MSSRFRNAHHLNDGARLVAHRHFAAALVKAGGVMACGTARAEASHKWMAHAVFALTHKAARNLGRRMGTQLQRADSRTAIMAGDESVVAVCARWRMGQHAHHTVVAIRRALG